MWVQMVWFLCPSASLSLWAGRLARFLIWARFTAPGTAGAYNGWVLLAVALLQVFS